jgi:hypothetical protein
MRHAIMMNMRARLAALICWAVAALVLSGCAGVGPAATAGPGEEPLLVQGLVQEISPATGTLAVKPNKEKAVYLSIDSRTAFSGVSSATALAKRQRVHVWYRVDGDRKIAVRIEKMPDQGC